MSVIAVSFSRLVCDGCGCEHGNVESLPEDATSARIKAAADGWKYRQFDARKGTGVPRNQKGPRQWDACPDCVLPATAAEAMKIGKAKT